MSAYARELGLTRYNISRYIQGIGDQGRHDGRHTAGLGLVTVTRSNTFHSHKNVFLTDKGRALAAEVFRNLSRDCLRGNWRKCVTIVRFTPLEL